MPRGRPKKVVEEVIEVEEAVEEEAKESPKQSLENQLARLDALRSEMHACGVDSISKLDVRAGQLIAEIAKL